MMMRINESWRDNLIFAVDDRDIFGCGDVLANLGDTVIRDQDIGVSENNNIVVFIMLENGAALEK